MRTVIKSDGRKEPFDPGKLSASCLRAGLKRRQCKKIVDEIIEEVVFPIRTRELFRLLKRKIEEFGKEYPFIYGLRYSISELDPVSFEKFVARMLGDNGYKAEWNKIVKGYAVEHQIDVVAEKSGRTYLVECKLHRNPHRDCGLGVVLQNRARLEDIMDNPGREYDFDRAWIVTNTKFSDHAKTYAKVRGIWLTGWRYESGRSMEALAEKAGSIPVTILNLDYRTRRRLLSRGIITLREFIGINPSEFGIGDRDFETLKGISIKIIRRVKSKWEK